MKRALVAAISVSWPVGCARRRREDVPGEGGKTCQGKNGELHRIYVVGVEFNYEDFYSYQRRFQLCSGSLTRKANICHTIQKEPPHRSGTKFSMYFFSGLKYA